MLLPLQHAPYIIVLHAKQHIRQENEHQRDEQQHEPRSHRIDRLHRDTTEERHKCEHRRDQRVNALIVAEEFCVRQPGVDDRPHK